MLTDQDRAVLAEHKADLVRLLAPPVYETEVSPRDEGGSVDRPEQTDTQWLESLGEVEADALLDRALSEWSDLVEPVDWWQHISIEDLAYLTGPRPEPSRCPWCKRWVGHSQLCVTHEWEPRLPFGKYQGRTVSETPLAYLRWLLANAQSLDSDLSEAIELQCV